MLRALLPLAAVLAVPGCARAQVGDLVPRPQIDLNLTPRASAIGREVVWTLAVLTVENPTPELRCANTVWHWPGYREGRAEDCLPDELEPWPVGKRMVLSKLLPLREGGPVVVELCQWVDDYSECVGQLREARAYFEEITTGEDR